MNNIQIYEEYMASFASLMKSFAASKSFEEKWGEQHRYNESTPGFIRPGHEQQGPICVVHSHLSLNELKEGITKGTLSDNRLLNILTRAQKDLATYKKFQNGMDDSDFLVSHKESKRKLTNDESNLIAEAINEDKLIVEICRRELRQVKMG